MEHRAGPAVSRAGLVGPRVVAVAVLALGGIVLLEATRIGGSGGYTAVGPTAFPLAVGVGLLALGVALLVRTTVRPDRDLAERTADEERATDWRTTLLLAAVLLAYALALAPLGYVLATGLFLPVGARVLGSGHPVRDLIVGFGVGLAVYLGFTQVLGVLLPAGLLDPVLP